MKIDEVPQDLQYLKGTIIRDLDYAVDDNGRYTAVLSSGWTPRNEALEITMDDIESECKSILQKIHNGESSPLEYHAAKNLMSVELLSNYSGISKKKIRKHFCPEEFAKLPEKILAVYADILRISIEELKTVPE